MARIQGNVVVQITIGADGVPISAKAVDGPSQLRPAAESYAMQYRFEPQMVGGVATEARFKLTVVFKLK
jgi:TonB family protein